MWFLITMGKLKKLWYTLFRGHCLSSCQSFKKNLFGQSPFLDWYFKMDEIKNHEFNV